MAKTEFDYSDFTPDEESRLRAAADKINKAHRDLCDSTLELGRLIEGMHELAGDDAVVKIVSESFVRRREVSYDEWLSCARDLIGVFEKFGDSVVLTPENKDEIVNANLYWMVSFMSEVAT